MLACVVYHLHKLVFSFCFAFGVVLMFNFLAKRVLRKCKI